MTFAKLKSACKVLLLGDNKLPQEPDDVYAALEMAYIEIANRTTALKLLTVNKSEAIMRQGPGDSYVRMPKLPKDENSELDVDNELVPAVARLIASYVSKDVQNKREHRRIANEIMIEYETKVQNFLTIQATGLDARRKSI